MTDTTNRSDGDLIDLHVVAAIILMDGKVMAAKRLAGGPSGLKWKFPGGKVELGEPPESALVREIAEELGMDVVVRAELGSFFTALGQWWLRLHCFVCDAVREPARLEAHSEIRWFAPSELSEIDWARPDIPAVEALRLFLSQN